MRGENLLIDFHVHLSRYEVWSDSAREWMASFYPSDEGRCGQKVGLPKEGVHKGCTQKSRKRMLWQSMKGQAR